MQEELSTKPASRTVRPSMCDDVHEVGPMWPAASILLDREYKGGKERREGVAWTW